MIKLVVDMARVKLTIDSWTGRKCRQEVRDMAHALAGDWCKVCQTLNSRNILGKQIKIVVNNQFPRISQLIGWPTPLDKNQILPDINAAQLNTPSTANLHPPKGVTILDVFPSYSELAKYTSLGLFHFVRTTQKEMKAQLSKNYLRLHAVEDPKSGILLSNHRLRGNSELQLDSNCYRLDNYQVANCLIILDKNTPLFIAFAKFIHHQYRQGPIDLGIKSAHKGAATDNLLSMRFLFAPGSLEVFKKIRRVCMACRLKCKTYALTNQGPLPEAAFQILKPFYTVNLDIFGPYTIKSSSNTRGTRGTKNTVKVWGLITVCRFSHAIWIELCEGASTAAIADALSRHQSIWGSIGFAVTDQLKSQLKVLAEGTFIEQIRLESWRKSGFLFEEVPVSRHAYNGFCEVRIRGVKDLIGRDSAQINSLSALQFTTILHSVCNLINATPLGSTMKDGAINPTLHVLTPNHFLVPRRNLIRVALSPLDLEGTGQDYFNKVSGIYEKILRHYEEDVLPLLLRPLKPKKADGGEVKTNNLVLFKRRAQDNFIPGWSLGIIKKVIVGKDGFSRAVILRYSNVDQRENSNPRPIDTDELIEQPGVVKGTAHFRYAVVDTHRCIDEIIILNPVDQQLDMLELLMSPDQGQ